MNDENHSTVEHEATHEATDTPIDTVVEVVEDAADTVAEVVEDAAGAVADAAAKVTDDDDDHDNVVALGDAAADAAAEVEEKARETALAIRHVLERQIVAGRGLSGELVGAATDAAAALVEAPASVVNAINGGATLPDAFGQTRASVQESFTDAGDRIRTAVGVYVNNQATLPHAVIKGAAEVAGSVVRAQGEVTRSAVDTALTVAAAATNGGHVRDTFDQEWQELSATAGATRKDIDTAISSARDGIREAVDEGGKYAEIAG
jgi:ABC-type transporter Mla subunit MlaD